MIQARIATTALALVLTSLALATEAGAQVCMGLPATDGQISLQGDVFTRDTETSYGGRLGMNFNTEFSIDVSLRRPRFENGNGTTIAGRIGYEMDEYEPPVCFLFGVRHERRPDLDGEDLTSTMIPVGVGIGKRLGSAKALSLAIFVIPEYVYVLDPKPVVESDDFWAKLRERSQGRGVLGLLLASPFLYATGSIEVTTVDDFEPTFSIGLGVTF